MKACELEAISTALGTGELEAVRTRLNGACREPFSSRGDTWGRVLRTLTFRSLQPLQHL